MNELKTLFDRLLLPKEIGQSIQVYSSILIPGFSGFHLAKDLESRPAIIISLKNKIDIPIHSIELENLRVEHNVYCKISSNAGQQSTDKFSLIQCLSKDHVLIEYFLDVMGVILTSLTDEITSLELTLAINKLVELFHKMKKPSLRSVQGLWAELLLIVHSRNPKIMLESWYSEPNELYDFNHGKYYLEVKCTSNRERKHYFSFEQAYPPRDSHVLVVSMFVDSTSNGTTLGELWDSARKLSGSNSELRIKIEQICIETLGDDWKIARDRAFDSQLALTSINFYDLDTIPRVHKKHPQGVSEIRFRSDLSHAKPIIRSNYKNSSPLFDSCLDISKI